MYALQLIVQVHIAVDQGVAKIIRLDDRGNLGMRLCLMYQKAPAKFVSGLLSHDAGDSAQKHCRVIRLGKVEENKQA